MSVDPDTVVGGASRTRNKLSTNVDFTDYDDFQMYLRALADDLFPFPSYQTNQDEILYETLEAFLIDDYLNVIVEGPTGIGKCLTGDTLVHTEDGLKRLQNVNGDDSVAAYDESGVFRTKDVTCRFEKGVKDTIKVTTDRGYEIEGTPEHKVKVLNSEGKMEWKKMGELSEGQYVPLSTMTVGGQTQTLSLPSIDPRYSSQFDGDMEVTEEVANFLGWFVADGNLTQGTVRLTCHKDRAQHMKRMAERAFPTLSPKISDYGNKSAVDIKIFSVELERLLNEVCYDNHGNKTIPDEIFASPVEVRREFIKGLFGGDATVGNAAVSLSTKSSDLATATQRLLQSLGVLTQKREKNQNGYTSYRVHVSGSDLRTFYETIGAFYSTSQCTIEELVEKDSNSNINVLPNMKVPLNNVWEQFKKTDHGQDLTNKSGIIKVMDSYRQDHAGPRKPSREQLTRFLDFMGVESEEEQWLRTLIDMPVQFDNISEISHSEAEVYDLNVCDLHNYVANGFISHNSAINVTVAQVLGEIASKQDTLEAHFDVTLRHLNDGSAFYTTPQSSLRNQLASTRWSAQSVARHRFHTVGAAIWVLALLWPLV